MPSRHVPIHALLAAFAAAFLFGSNGSVVKVVTDSGITPEQLTFFRCLATTVCAGVALLFVDPGKGFRLSLRETGQTIALGLIGIACVQWFYASAITLIPVGIVLLIEYTAVLMVAVVARFVFKEAVKPRLWGAIALVLVGLTIVAAQGSDGAALNPIGALLAFAGAVCYAAYFLLAERQVSTRNPMSVTFWSMLWASLIWGVFSSWWAIEPSTLTASVSTGGITVPVWVPLLWAGTMGSFLPFLLSYTALRYMSATSAGIIASSEIIWAFEVAWAWLGQALSIVQLMGVAVVATGIVLAQTARSSRASDVTSTSPATVPIPVIRPPEQTSVTPRGNTGEHTPRA
ncbi:MAG TPA: EamA family transporter [Pseudoclavibacter sp.]|nr:EamA family transporter [Pseudoclavibacter sp.]